MDLRAVASVKVDALLAASGASRRLSRAERGGGIAAGVARVPVVERKGFRVISGCRLDDGSDDVAGLAERGVRLCDVLGVVGGRALNVRAPLTGIVVPHGGVT
mmetsp:Transcript_24340/g.44674  ORF Transcript_24340/g.44674 Transcript_24340/m.44674 type:complete len:103 (+) Transcript_24340:178-486(+)